ncbi:transcription factor IIIA-like isoform X2 [Gigantopelta aegis]|uniref:transcription factor IIIA-like isoform X2 n=1 Tax=Gigantopelta aegis TaxID=1735272 RepID=UPI001B88C3ED|nr:transcription factor IIIA-like isoform X2 [Gigantopelta aegis]
MYRLKCPVTQTINSECQRAAVLSCSAQRPYLCTELGCGKSYARAAHLTRHQQLSHPGSEELETLQSYTCSHEGCGQLFTFPHNLKRHIKRVHTNKVYQCSFSGCDKSFRKHHQLKAHQFEHTSVDPYVCSEDGCGKRFSVLSKFRRHQKIHQDFTCNVDGCSFKVKKWTLLRKHKAVEHGPSHKCSHCEKVFKLKSWLKCHMVVHQDMREAFECPRADCGRVYFNERNLAAHLRTYHDGLRFPCSVEGCGRTLCSKSKLHQHLKLHNPNKPLPKRRKKKSIAAVVSGYIAKRVIGVNDIYKCSDSEEDKISVEPMKQREVTLSTTPSTVTSHSTYNDYLEPDSSETESVTSRAVADVSMVTHDDVSMVIHDDVSISEHGQDIKSSCDSSKKDTVLEDTDSSVSTNNSLSTNNLLNKVHFGKTCFSDDESASKDISLQSFISTTFDSASIRLKSYSAAGGLTKGNYSIHAGSVCSAASLPVGQILEKSSIINKS